MRKAPKKKHQQVDPEQVRGLMIATGLSDEQIRKLIRSKSSPRNFLIRDAWNKELARQAKGLAHV